MKRARLIATDRERRRLLIDVGRGRAIIVDMEMRRRWPAGLIAVHMKFSDAHDWIPTADDPLLVDRAFRFEVERSGSGPVVRMPAPLTIEQLQVRVCCGPPLVLEELSDEQRALVASLQRTLEEIEAHNTLVRSGEAPGPCWHLGIVSE